MDEAVTIIYEVSDGRPVVRTETRLATLKILEESARGKWPPLGVGEAIAAIRGGAARVIWRRARGGEVDAITVGP